MAHKFDTEWRAHYEGILENIKTNATYKPPYKHSTPKRAWTLCSFAACTMACCTPCCVYDVVCCSVHRLCGASCPHGMYCLFANTVIDNTYEHKNRIAPHTKFDVSSETVRDVCKKYLIEFDMCIVQRTARHACMANEIREFLVYIIKNYLDRPDIYDDGNVDKLRNIVYNIDA